VLRKSSEQLITRSERFVAVLDPAGTLLRQAAAAENALAAAGHDGPSTLGYDCRLLTPGQVHQLTPGANPEGLRGGLFSGTELCVNPPLAIRHITHWLQERFGVELRFGAQIGRAISDKDSSAVRLETSQGQCGPFDHVVVCSGAEFQSLFPEAYRGMGIRLCKLQMMRTPRWDNWRLGPHLASGLALRHYQSFEVCRSLEPLKSRIANETPELDRFGIHVMAAQNDAGEIILGDSHEYDEEISPFDRVEIDELILRELRKMLRLPAWDIAARWHGVYAKLPGRAVLEANPLARVVICTATGGAGMTMSFGLAERTWRRWSE
jgi:FAD dependent oxidoreductase TIGR03364